jgi:hypothetical protein
MHITCVAARYIHSAPTQQVMCSPFGTTEVHLPRLLHRSCRRVGAAAAVTVQARVITGYPSSQSRAVAASTSPDKARILDYGCRTRPVGEST